MEIENIFNYINKFVNFDIKEIFNFGDPIIFGGAIRDSLADKEIHDVDIITIGKTFEKIDNFLKSKKYRSDICEFKEMSTNCHCEICNTRYEIEWFNVVTYHFCSKIDFMNNVSYIPIQLIVPKFGHFFMSDEGKSKGFKAEYNRLKSRYIFENESIEKIKSFMIEEVDLSCCAVSIKKENNKYYLNEKYDAINDCKNSQFRTILNSEFNNESRTLGRINKLKLRGWNFLEYSPIIKQNFKF
jgi:hypothetical protein